MTSYQKACLKVLRDARKESLRLIPGPYIAQLTRIDYRYVRETMAELQEMGFLIFSESGWGGGYVLLGHRDEGNFTLPEVAAAKIYGERWATKYAASNRTASSSLGQLKPMCEELHLKEGLEVVTVAAHQELSAAFSMDSARKELRNLEI